MEGDMVATRVIGYVRVSTEDQAENGNGLDYQRRAIEMWAHRNRLELVTVLSDEGVSGKEGIAGRRGLPLALGMVADGVADGIAVWKLDRLARDLYLQEFIVKELGRHGGRLYSTMDGENENLGDNSTDPTRKLVRQILGAIAEYESAMITARMQAGKASKRRHGGYIGGFTPYGMRHANDQGELEPDPDEMAVVDRMIELRAAGGSFAKVARKLNEEGLPPRNGKKWYPSTVRRVLLRAAPQMTQDTNGKPLGLPGLGAMLPEGLEPIGIGGKSND